MPHKDVTSSAGLWLTCQRHVNLCGEAWALHIYTVIPQTPIKCQNMPHLSTSVWCGLEISTPGLHVQNASWVAISLVQLIAFSGVDCYKAYFESKDICCATSVDKSAHVPAPSQRSRAKHCWAVAEAGGAASLLHTQRCPFTCRDPSLSTFFQIRLIFTHTTHFLSGSPQPCPPMQQHNCSHSQFSHESGNMGFQGKFLSFMSNCSLH